MRIYCWCFCLLAGLLFIAPTGTAVDAYSDPLESFYKIIHPGMLVDDLHAKLDELDKQKSKFVNIKVWNYVSMIFIGWSGDYDPFLGNDPKQKQKYPSSEVIIRLDGSVIVCVRYAFHFDGYDEIKSKGPCN